MEVEATRRRGLASTGARAMQTRLISDARTAEVQPGAQPDGNLPAPTVTSDSAYSAARSYSATAEEESSAGDGTAAPAHRQRVRHHGRIPARGQSITGTRDHAANEQHSLGRQPGRQRPRRTAQSARGASSAAVRSPPLRRSRRNANRRQQEALRPPQSTVRRVRKPRKQLRRLYAPNLEFAPAPAQVTKSILAWPPFLPACALACLVPAYCCL